MEKLDKDIREYEEKMYAKDDEEVYEFEEALREAFILGKETLDTLTIKDTIIEVFNDIFKSDLNIAIHRKQR